ncbi:hypothetical protein HDU92_009042, partial [Lobulomyces angularis]
GFHNRITKIENLPSNLIEFGCFDNRITKIENLPDSLKIFRCCNQIKKIENLPLGLSYIDIEGVRVLIESVDDVPYDFWSEFSLKGYQAVKRIQKRLSRRHKFKINAVRRIQAGCRNWIWKPLCKDGTIGIRPRLDLKHFNIE